MDAASNRPVARGRPRGIAVLAIALAISAPACGSDEPTTSGPPATSPTTTTTAGSVEPIAGAQRWIVEQTDATAVSSNGSSSDLEPAKANELSEAFFAEFQELVGPGFTRASLGRDVVADREDIHYGRLRNGPIGVSFSTQLLIEPIAIIPPEGSPLREMGSYRQDDDGTEILIADTHQAFGTTNAADRHVYVVDPSGWMTELSFGLIDPDAENDPTYDAEWLVHIGRALNEVAEQHSS